MITDTIINTLRNDLQSDHYKQAGQLPPFRDLAQRYNCSPASIKRAVDYLRREGLLLSAGKRIFLANAAPRGSYIKRNRVIGIIVLNDSSRKTIENIKETWLKKGWLLAVYNASEDHQASERERQFLLTAEAEGFTAVIMTATPLEPCNTALFPKLRHEGMKIAHLNPYRKEMEEECYFMPDWRATGRLAVSQAAMYGYRRIAYVNNRNVPPFKEWQFEGIQEMTYGLGLELLPEVDLDASQISALSTDTAYLCASPDSALALQQRLRKNGKSLVISLSESLDSNNNEVYDAEVVFNSAEQLNAALEYATDESIGSLERVQRLFPPIFKTKNLCPKDVVS